MRKSVTYHVTLFYNDVRALADRIKSALFKSPPKWKWWNKVHTSQSGGGEIYLGAIPISKQLFGLPLRNDLNTLTQTCGVKAILSAVEEFEINASGLVIRPIKKEQWKKAGISQCHIDTPDFQSIGLEKIDQGVEFLRRHLKEGRSVYVHCKAGRGRSSLIVAAYLTKYEGLTPGEAYALLKSRRPQVDIPARNVECLKSYVSNSKEAFFN